MTDYVLVLDTETTNSLDDPIVYDIGFAVVDFLGNVYETHSFVVADVFLDKELMASAFYAEKIPQYWDDIKSGKRGLRKYSTIRRVLRDVCRKWNVTDIYAHNMRFDNRSCNLTQRFLTSSKYRFFFPYGTQLHDTLKMSRNILKHDNNYGEFCYNNDYITMNGQRRYTAEIIYRYITGNNDFVEEHKGLDDVMIEKDILAYCMNKDSSVESALWG
jgi:hypothetical protein